MTPEWQAIAALAAFIQVGILGAFKWLTAERAKDQAACNERIAKLEARLDEGAETMRRLNAVLQKQVDAHEVTIAALTKSEGGRR